MDRDAIIKFYSQANWSRKEPVDKSYVEDWLEANFKFYSEQNNSRSVIAVCDSQPDCASELNFWDGRAQTSEVESLDSLAKKHNFVKAIKLKFFDRNRSLEEVYSKDTQGSPKKKSSTQSKLINVIRYFRGTKATSKRSSSYRNSCWPTFKLPKTIARGGSFTSDWVNIDSDSVRSKTTGTSSFISGRRVLNYAGKMTWDTKETPNKTEEKDPTSPLMKLEKATSTAERTHCCGCRSIINKFDMREEINKCQQSFVKQDTEQCPHILVGDCCSGKLNAFDEYRGFEEGKSTQVGKKVCQKKESNNFPLYRESFSGEHFFNISRINYPTSTESGNFFQQDPADFGRNDSSREGDQCKQLSYLILRRNGFASRNVLEERAVQTKKEDRPESPKIKTSSHSSLKLLLDYFKFIGNNKKPDPEKNKPQSQKRPTEHNKPGLIFGSFLRRKCSGESLDLKNFFRKDQSKISVSISDFDPEDFQLPPPAENAPRIPIIRDHPNYKRMSNITFTPRRAEYMYK